MLKQKTNEGFALAIALVGLVALTSVFVFFMGKSQRFKDVSEQKSSQTQAQWQVSGSLEEVKSELLRQVQARLSSLEAGSAPQTPLNVGLQSVLAQIPTLSDRALELSCIGEGPTLSSCSLRQVFPKIFRTLVRSLSEDGQVSSLIRAEIQVQNAKLNSYAFLVKNETRPQLNIGKSLINGLFGVNFSQEALSTGSAKIYFRTESGPITFQKAFVTNLSDASSLEPTDQNQLHLNGGIILGHRALSFEALPLLFEDLKRNAVNQSWVTENQNPWSNQWLTSTTAASQKTVGGGYIAVNSVLLAEGTVDGGDVSNSIQCSRVIFEGESRVTLEKYTTGDCSGPAAQIFRDKSISHNQALYAEGGEVRLQARGDGYEFRQKAIAILADGNIRFETPMVRDATNPSHEGYITLISKGNLVVDASASSLVPDKKLSQLTTALLPSDGSSTFQADVSFIGIGEQNSAVVFDSSLFNVSNGIALGRAEFNGLFVGTTMPSTKVMTTSGGVTTVKGFEETNWNFPLALQGLNTDWFKAELSGGVLQAVVTKIQKTEINLQQAIEDMKASTGTTLQPVGVDRVMTVE